MYIYQVSRVNVFVALAVCCCLATVWLCMRIVKGRLGPDRFLLGVLGFLSVFQGLRILINQNVGLANALQRFQGIADAATAALFLLAACILRTSTAEHAGTMLRLRLVEGEKRASASPSRMVRAETQEPQPAAPGGAACSRSSSLPAQSWAILGRLVRGH